MPYAALFWLSRPPPLLLFLPQAPPPELDENGQPIEEPPPLPEDPSAPAPKPSTVSLPAPEPPLPPNFDSETAALHFKVDAASRGGRGGGAVLLFCCFAVFVPRSL